LLPRRFLTPPRIKHHVKEEESPGGMFAEARKSKMDLLALGEQLLERKQALQSTSEAEIANAICRAEHRLLREFRACAWLFVQPRGVSACGLTLAPIPPHDFIVGVATTAATDVR
jgi:hypothetical protein